MDDGFGLLVDFLRGELDEASAAEVRARLERDDDLFANFQRLRRTMAVVRSFPALPVRAAETGRLRDQLETRDWLRQLPAMAASPAFLRSLRVEFSVRALVASLPALKPSESLVQVLRREFAVRQVAARLPEACPRTEFRRRLRDEFSLRALVSSLPMLPAREAFLRRLRVAFAELDQAAPARAAASLPLLAPTPAFRDRIREAIRREAASVFGRRAKRSASKELRAPRRRPQRSLLSGAGWGRMILSQAKRSRSLLFTGLVHAAALAIAFFVSVGAALPAASVNVQQIVGEGIAVPVLGGVARGESRDPGFSSPEEAGVGGGLPEVVLVRDDGFAPGLGEEGLPPPVSREQPEEAAKPRPESVSSDEPLRSSPALGGGVMFRLREMDRSRKIGYLGSEELFDVLDRALGYLSRTQKPDGSWGFEGVDARLVPNDAEIREARTIELTSAAALAFLGDGHNSRESVLGYDLHVRRAVGYLLKRQGEDGQIGPAGTPVVLSHAMALLVLLEDYALSGDRKLKRPIRKAARWLCETRAVAEDGSTNAAFPYLRGQGPSLMTGVWAHMALATAARLNIPEADLPPERLDAFLDWFEAETRSGDVLKDQWEALNGDLVPSAAAASLTGFAEGRGFEMRKRRFFGRMNRELPDLEPTAQTLEYNAPGDMRYLFFGSLARALSGEGSADDAWRRAFARTLIERQTAEGAGKGSFAVSDYYAGLGGKVLGAAFAALSIENAWRVTLDH